MKINTKEKRKGKVYCNLQIKLVFDWYKSCWSWFISMFIIYMRIFSQKKKNLHANQFKST